MEMPKYLRALFDMATFGYSDSVQQKIQQLGNYAIVYLTTQTPITREYIGTQELRRVPSYRSDPYAPPYQNGSPIKELRYDQLIKSMADYGGIFLVTRYGNGLPRSDKIDARLLNDESELRNDLLNEDGFVDKLAVIKHLRALKGKTIDDLVFDLDEDEDKIFDFALRFQKMALLGFPIEVRINPKSPTLSDYHVFQYQVRQILPRELKNLTGLEAKVLQNGTFAIRVTSNTEYVTFMQADGGIPIDNRARISGSGFEYSISDKLPKFGSRVVVRDQAMIVPESQDKALEMSGISKDPKTKESPFYSEVFIFPYQVV